MRYHPGPHVEAAQPGETLPDPVDGETAHQAVTAAIAWEWRRRLAGGVEARPEEHGAAFAQVALGVLWRGEWLTRRRGGPLTATEGADLEVFVQTRRPTFRGDPEPDDEGDDDATG